MQNLVTFQISLSFRENEMGHIIVAFLKWKSKAAYIFCVSDVDILLFFITQNVEFVPTPKKNYERGLRVNFFSFGHRKLFQFFQGAFNISCPKWMKCDLIVLFDSPGFKFDPYLSLHWFYLNFTCLDVVSLFCFGSQFLVTCFFFWGQKFCYTIEYFSFI